MAWAMRNLEEYEAYDKLEESYAYSEEIRDENFKKIVEQINAEFNVETVRANAENKRILREQKFWIGIISNAVIIISLIFYALFYRQRKQTLALKLANIDHI